jgi:hypothetical protein
MSKVQMCTDYVEFKSADKGGLMRQKDGVVNGPSHEDCGRVLT